MNDGYFGRDHEFVFWGIHPFPKADVKHWRRLGGAYSKDNARIYFTRAEIPGVDYDSFEVVASAIRQLARDRNHFYWGADIVEPFKIKGVLEQEFGWAPFEPRWLTSTVVGLAQSIRHELAFDRQGILADALMEAGCSDKSILDVCREGERLQLGSLIVDLILFHQSRQKEPSRPTTQALKILVVADDEEMKQRWEWMLENAGYPVRTAAGGKEALKIVTEWEPNCVFLKLSMPGMDGYASARKIRQQQPTKKITLIGLAVAFEETQLRRMQEAGFDTHVVSSAEASEVLGILGGLKGTSA
jgi:CheY-like chemotaxis protein